MKKISKLLKMAAKMQRHSGIIRSYYAHALQHAIISCEKSLTYNKRALSLFKTLVPYIEAGQLPVIRANNPFLYEEHLREGDRFYRFCQQYSCFELYCCRGPIGQVGWALLAYLNDFSLELGIVFIPLGKDIYTISL
ncbi:unknown [Clostridium sp. CAG:567]|jgi:hypothetical protein|nr:unknown [Clostridium sp. CAG:567]